MLFTLEKCNSWLTLKKISWKTRIPVVHKRACLEVESSSEKTWKNNFLVLYYYFHNISISDLYFFYAIFNWIFFTWLLKSRTNLMCMSVVLVCKQNNIKQLLITDGYHTYHIVLSCILIFGKLRYMYLCI